MVAQRDDAGLGDTDLAGLLAAAADVTSHVLIIDVQDPRFVPPGDMHARIGRARRRSANSAHRSKHRIEVQKELDARGG